jgi:hypothetical protein
MDEKEFYSMVEASCVPFLQTAAMIKHNGITKSNAHESTIALTEDFASLRNYVLAINDGDREKHLRWSDTENGIVVVRHWVDELNRLKSKSTKWSEVSNVYIFRFWMAEHWDWLS